MDLTYILAIAATLAFSVTGVLAARIQQLDIIGVTVVGVVTAVGGGTIRDIILDVPVFWIADGRYLLAATLAALVTFAFNDLIHRGYRWFLYMDALGVALFAALAVMKTLALGLGSAHAVVMGVITGIGGGIIRDVLLDRPTLIVSRELYATPIVLGVGLQLALLQTGLLDAQQAVITGVAAVFSFRAAAIYFQWQMPDILTLSNRPPVTNPDE